MLLSQEFTMTFSKIFLLISIVCLSVVLSGCLNEQEKQQLKDYIFLSKEERYAKKMEEKRVQEEIAQRALDEQRKSFILRSINADIRRKFYNKCEEVKIPCLHIQIISTDYIGRYSKDTFTTKYSIKYEAKVLHRDDGWTRQYANYQGTYYYEFLGSDVNRVGSSEMSIQPIGQSKDLGTGGAIAAGVGLAIVGKILED